MVDAESLALSIATGGLSDAVPIKKEPKV